MHVAALVRAQHRHALAAQAELVAALGSGRHIDARARAVERGHLDGAAEGCRRHRNRHAAENIGAVALEEEVRLDGEKDVEVAGRRSPHAGLALAGEPDARAVLDPRRDRDRKRLLARDPSAAVADAARIADDAARALARRAGALDGEEALLRAHAAMAMAGLAARRLRPAFPARALARLAHDRARHADLGLAAAEGLLERDLEVVAQVGTACGSGAATPVAGELAEHFV